MLHNVRAPSWTILGPYLTHYKLANKTDHSRPACVYSATCLTSMCVQSDKTTRMLFIYNSSHAPLLPSISTSFFFFSPLILSRGAPSGKFKRIFGRNKNKRHIVSAGVVRPGHVNRPRRAKSVTLRLPSSPRAPRTSTAKYTSVGPTADRLLWTVPR